MSEATRPPETWPAERKHHPFSPSTLQNREACPCYEGRDSQHVRSIAGTLAHEVVETRKDNKDLSDEDLIAAAECIDFVDGRFELMLSARTQAVNTRLEKLQDAEMFEDEEVEEGSIDDLSDTEFANRERAESEISEVQEFKEIYLSIDECHYEDAESTTGGYVDSLLIDHTEENAEMSDWKFGMWPVESAENNLQCICYVLGAFRKFPKLKTIRFFFRQPLLELYSEAVFTREQVSALYLRVQTVVHRARKAREMVKAGDYSMANPMVPACNFCANLGDCPKVLAMMCRIGNKFYPLEIPDDITPSKVIAKDQTALGLRLAQVVKIWADSFRATTTDRVLRGGADLPEGFIIQSQSRRQLVNKEKFKEIALLYLTEAEFTGTLDVLFGAVEKAIQDKAPRGHKKTTVEQFQEELDNAGATQRGLPFSFLRAKPSKEVATETKTESIKA